MAPVVPRMVRHLRASSFMSLFSFGSNSSIVSTSTSLATSSLNRLFVVGPDYSPIREKLVTKIRSGQLASGEFKSPGDRAPNIP